MVLLCHPVSLTRSRYNQLSLFNGRQRREDADPKRFVEKPDTMCRWLMKKFPSFIVDPNASPSRCAMDILECFDFVLVTESLDEQLSTVSRWLDLSGNVERRRVAQDKTDLGYTDEEILEFNQEDIKLFEACRQQTQLRDGRMNPLQFNSERRADIVSQISNKTSRDDMYARLALSLSKYLWAIGALEWLDKKPDHIGDPELLRHHLNKSWQKLLPTLSKEQLEIAEQKAKKIRKRFN